MRVLHRTDERRGVLVVQDAQNVAVFVVLVLVLVFRPSGLLGEVLPDKA